MSKLDLQVAYGSDDLTKIRLTPYTIGVLISKMKPDDLKECLKGYSDQQYYRTKEAVGKHVEIFKTWFK